MVFGLWLTCAPGVTRCAIDGLLVDLKHLLGSTARERSPRRSSQMPPRSRYRPRFRARWETTRMVSLRAHPLRSRIARIKLFCTGSILKPAPKEGGKPRWRRLDEIRSQTFLLPSTPPHRNPAGTSGRLKREAVDQRYSGSHRITLERIFAQ